MMTTRLAPTESSKAAAIGLLACSLQNLDYAARHLQQYGRLKFDLKRQLNLLQAQVTHAQAVAEELRRREQGNLEFGDYNQPLLITPNGVEVNGDLVDIDYIISRNVVEANWALDAEEEEGGEDGDA